LAARDGLELLSALVGDLLPHSAEPRALALAYALGTLHGVSGETTRALEAWFRAQSAEPDEVEELTKASPLVAPALPTLPVAQQVRSEAPVVQAVAPSSVPGWVWPVATLALVAALLWFAR